MPIYEYRCLDCGREFEVMQKITDDPLERCQFCSGKVQRLISLSNFQLKGSGWYATDYKNRSDKGKKEKDKGKKDKEEGKGGEEGD